MLAGAAKWDLLYVSNTNGTVTVYRYWKHNLVGKLYGFVSPEGECVDGTENVFITDSEASDIVEYAHGVTTPTRILHDGQFRPDSCSVDPTTGKLAVTGRGAVAIYKHRSIHPTIFSTRCCIVSPVACAYDDKGDLFVAGFTGSLSTFAELPKHGLSFIPVNPSVSSSSEWLGVESILWDGRYFAIGESGAWRFRVRRDGHAIYKGYTELDGAVNEGESWIPHFSANPNRQGTQIVAAVGTEGQGPGSVLYWNYPAGGEPIATITYGIQHPYGVTVSRKQ